MRQKRGLRTKPCNRDRSRIRVRAREIESLVALGSANGIDFEAVQTTMRRCALTLAARLVEQILKADGANLKAATMSRQLSPVIRRIIHI